MKVELTKSQCENLAEWIEMWLIDVIRKDEEIDNIGWIKDMILAMETLDQAAKVANENENA